MIKLQELPENPNDPLTTRTPPVRDPVSVPLSSDERERGRQAARALKRRGARLARESIVYRQWQLPPPPPSHVVRDVTIAILAVVLGLVFLFADAAPVPLIAGW